MIRKIVTMTSVLAVLSLTMVGGAYSQTESEEDDENGLCLSGGVDAAFYSKYIWRGMELNSEGVFQPEVWLSFMGLGVSAWANMELTDIFDHRGEITEVDYSAFYSLELGPVYASLIYVYYDYPFEHSENTQEVGLELEWGETLVLGLEAFYDFDQVKGTYLKPSLSYSLELDPFILVPSVGLGWGSKSTNDYNFGVDKDSLVDLEVALEAIVELDWGFYLSLLGSYYTLLDNDLKDEAGDAKDGFWGGGSVGFEF